MAKIVAVTRTYADIERGDVAAVFDDHEDEGGDVRKLDLFRVIRVPGPKSDYAHLVAVTPVKDGAPPPTKYFSKGVVLDTIEAAEVARIKKPLVADDECVVATKVALEALAVVKPIEAVAEVLPPVSAETA